MLLLDDGRYMLPSPFSSGIATEDGLYIPDTVLQPLTRHDPVDMKLVYEQLDALI